MPVRRVSRSCANTLQRHVACASSSSSPSTDGIWITDQLLDYALERYTRVSRATRRAASFTPGPLESRRRLGKRGMTELNVAGQLHPSSVPPWAFKHPPDFKGLTWLPPTPADARQSAAPIISMEPPLESQRPTVQTLVARLLWGNSAEDATTDLEEVDVRTDELARPAAEQVKEEDALSTNPELLLRRLLLLEEADGPLASLISSGEEAAFSDEIVRNIDTLRLHISRADLSPSQVVMAMDVISRAVLGPSQQWPNVGRRCLSGLYRTVMLALTGSRAYDAGDLSVMWRAVMERLSRLHEDTGLLGLFRLAMTGMPYAVRCQCEREILCVARKIAHGWDDVLSGRVSAVDLASGEYEVFSSALFALRTALDDGGLSRARELADAAAGALRICNRALELASSVYASESLWQLRPMIMAEALRHIRRPHEWSTPEHVRMLNRLLLGTASQLVRLQERHPPDFAHRLRYSWLSTASQIPQVRMWAFTRLVDLFYCLDGTKQHQGLLSNMDICLLLVDQWASRGYLADADSARIRAGLTAESDESCFAYLADAVSRVPRIWTENGAVLRTAVYGGIWHVAGRLGRRQEVVRSLQMSSHRIKLRWKALHRLAESSLDAHAAADIMMVHGQYETISMWSTLKGSQLTLPFDLAQVALSKVTDPAYGPYHAFAVLGLPVVSPNGRSQRKRALVLYRRRITPRMADIVTQVSLAVEQAPHLTTRQALRYTEHSVEVLRRHKQCVRVAIQSLLRVLIRDLPEKLELRVPRILWLLRIIARSSSPEVAEETREILIRRLGLARRRADLLEAMRRYNPEK